MENRFNVFIKAMLIVAIILNFLNFSIIGTLAFMTDSDSQPPPASGTYTYSPPGNFMPDNAGFPAVGESYTDPVFGETVKRITDTYPMAGANGHIQYSSKPMINADSTMMITQDAFAGRLDIRDMDGNLLKTNAFSYTNENFHWHPTDKNRIIFINGANLREYDYSTDTSTTLKTFASAATNGGTLEICDQTARYYVAIIDNLTDLVVWDRIEDALYTGGRTNISGNDYVGMCPDGSYVLVGGDSGWTTSYPLNHGTNTIGSKNQLCNALTHGDTMTDSDGVTWFVFDAMPTTYPVNAAALVAVRVDTSSPSVTWKYAFNHGNWTLDGHAGCNVIGDNRDWFAWNSEEVTNYNDSDPWTPWVSYRDEIILINIKTGEIRRLCHHRSRTTNGTFNYYWQPKASISIDGKIVAFSSNMGRTIVNYCDAYTVTTGLGPPAAPQNLRIIKIE